MPSSQRTTRSSNEYRHLDQYYGLIPGTVGTVRGSDGQLQSPPVPAFAPAMAIQTVPNYSKSTCMGTPNALQHCTAPNDMQNGHFTVDHAYPKDCTTFQKRSCDGNIPK